jgi:hypothetical protein
LNVSHRIHCDHIDIFHHIKKPEKGGSPIPALIRGSNKPPQTCQERRILVHKLE